MVPAPLARLATQRLSIPTIGIGAGPDCDGQVLVFHDLVGLFSGFTPSFVKRYAEAGGRGPLAPAPAVPPEPVVQVYAARTRGAKGAFGLHTWVAVKPGRASAWTVYEVIGWRLRYGDSALAIRHRDPDARWFGNEPQLLAE